MVVERRRDTIYRMSGPTRACVCALYVRVCVHLVPTLPAKVPLLLDTYTWCIHYTENMQMLA